MALAQYNAKLMLSTLFLRPEDMGGSLLVRNRPFLRGKLHLGRVCLRRNKVELVSQIQAIGRSNWEQPRLRVPQLKRPVSRFLSRSVPLVEILLKDSGTVRSATLDIDCELLP